MQDRRSQIWGIFSPLLTYVVVNVAVSIVFLIVFYIYCVVTVPGQTTMFYTIWANAMLTEWTLPLIGAVGLAMTVVGHRMYQRDKILSDRREMDRLSAGNLAVLAVLGMLSSFGLNGVLTLIPVMEFFPGYDSLASTIFSSNLFLQIGVTVLIVPVMEEILFRGIIFHRLKHLADMKVAALVVSLMFGVYHGNMVQGIYAFLFSLILVAAMEQYQTVFAPICVHVSGNLLSVILSNTSIFDGISEKKSLLAVSSIACIVLILVIIIGKQRKKKDN